MNDFSEMLKELKEAVKAAKDEARNESIKSAALDWGTTEEKARDAFDFFDELREAAQDMARTQGIQIGADVVLEGLRGAMKRDKRVLDLLLSDTELVAHVKESEDGSGIIFALGIDARKLDDAARSELQQLEKDLAPQVSARDIPYFSDFLQ